MDVLRVWAGLGLSAAVAVTVSATGVPAQAAGAAGVVSVVSGTKVQYKSATGKQSNVVVTRSGKTVTVDDKVAVRAGQGCKAVKGDKTKVRCTTKKAPTQVRVYTYDRNDRITNKSGLPMIGSGGSGNDRIIGGSRWDYLYGGPGNDTIWGSAGNDHIFGDSGNDTLYGGAGHDEILDGTGNDVVRGGNGNDWFGGYLGKDKFFGEGGDDVFAPSQPEGTAYKNDADYFSGGTGMDRAEYLYTKAVSLDLDGVKGDDGMAGEHDTIAADVENLGGGEGNDRLVGNDRANWLWGGGGKDVLYGNGGNDDLSGGDGADKLYGGAGDDWLEGRESGDVDRVVDVMSGGANGSTGDSCIAKSRAQLTGCENYHSLF